MSSDALWWSWGPPSRIDKLDTPSERSEVWDYTFDYTRPRTVTLVEGKVSWWHLQE